MCSCVCWLFSWVVSCAGWSILGVFGAFSSLGADFSGAGVFGVMIVFLCAGRARAGVVLVWSVARARGFLVWCVLDCSFLGFACEGGG